MNYFLSKLIVLFTLISILILSTFVYLPVGTVLAEENLEQTCLQIAENDFNCGGMTGSDCRILLEKCATFYEEESDRIAQDITKTEKEKKTLQSQITTLKKKVQGLGYEIKQGNIIIKDLTLQIKETKSSIGKIILQIEESKYQISNVLRTINEEDQKSSIEILIEGNLSAFFNNLVYLEGLNTKLRDLLKNTQDLKLYLEGQEVKMDDEKSQTERAIKVQSLQKQESESSKKQQEGLLKLTEAEYQKQLKEKQEAQKKSATIRARIFDLLGVSKAPTFGEAYEIAKYASSITGVRVALILAVLTQESNIGKQVGQCYLKDTKNGSGVFIKTGKSVSHVMSMTSIPYFLNIIDKLNKSKGLERDPFETPVSCPIASVGGYGGAMGPAQFIPSTWSKYGYDKKVEAITGKTADPWDIRDAFLAAAILLKDNGANVKSKEFKAVMMYFSGSYWRKSEEFYGRSVLAIATGYTDDIAALEN
ncbi:lytic murein transglycosylase [Patescibacteria group bacterium]|nr:lytic murein transglycosylase [Patescibacteria group bacterium]